MDGWMGDGWMNGWMNEWMDGWHKYKVGRKSQC